MLSAERSKKPDPRKANGKGKHGSHSAGKQLSWTRAAQSQRSTTQREAGKPRGAHTDYKANTAQAQQAKHHRSSQNAFDLEVRRRVDFLSKTSPEFIALSCVANRLCFCHFDS